MPTSSSERLKTPDGFISLHNFAPVVSRASLWPQYLSTVFRREPPKIALGASSRERTSQSPFTYLSYRLPRKKLLNHKAKWKKERPCTYINWGIVSKTRTTPQSYKTKISWKAAAWILISEREWTWPTRRQKSAFFDKKRSLSFFFGY